MKVKKINYNMIKMSCAVSYQFFGLSLQIILKVYSSDDSEKCYEVPVTPETICQDVVACVSTEDSSYLVQLWNGQGQE